MAFTSEWILNEVDRGSDTGTSGGLVMTRNAWTVSRSRFSDDTFTSQKDAVSATVVGKNGGVEETITAPNREQITFGTARNWIATTDVFVRAGYDVNSRPVYVMDVGFKSKYSGRTLVICAAGTTVGSGSFLWTAKDLSAEDAASSNFSRVYTEDLPYATTASVVTINSASALTPHALAFTGSGVFSGASTATVSTAGGKFLCVSDAQSYGQIGVDWYRQTQTWVYRDAWRTA